MGARRERLAAPDRPHPLRGRPAVRNSSSGAARLANSGSAPAVSGAPSKDRRGLMGLARPTAHVAHFVFYSGGISARHGKVSYSLLVFPQIRIIRQVFMLHWLAPFAVAVFAETAFHGSPMASNSRAKNTRVGRLNMEHLCRILTSNS